MLNRYLLLLTSLIFLSCSDKTIEKNTPKVLIHYMGWYGSKTTTNHPNRHWEKGFKNTPIIGSYNSQSKATLYYHTLLAWAAGIDGIAINVKDEYDHKTMELLFNTIDELNEMTPNDFSFDYLVSFDDQGFDLQKPLDTTIQKLTYFKNNILSRKNYLKHKNRPLIFSFDYPNKFLSAKDFDTSLNTVFKNYKPYLIWNTFGQGEETTSYVGAFYPWVQPSLKWETDGSDWGGSYLEHFYKSVNEFNQPYDFVCGGVWPGFDDTKNISWGGNRVISRQKGNTYNNTWKKVINYQGKTPLQYVVIETWNDWNEGTEIEPSLEHGYQYLQQTAEQINLFKGTETSVNSSSFKIVKNIFDLIQRNEIQNKTVIDKKIKSIIIAFCSKDYVKVQDLITDY